MGLDWIDDLLEKAEGLPGLGGIAHDLRFAYEIMREKPPDPQPVRNQTSALGDLHGRATNLYNVYNEHLLKLRQNWSGEVADYYFGPQVTASQMEHDMEPSTTGAGYQLWNRFSQMTSLLEYNQAAHQSAVGVLEQLVDLSEELESDVYEAAGLLAADVATTATPGLEELDAIDVPITAERVGEAVQTARKVEEVGKLVKDVETVEKTIKTGITIAQLVKVVGTIGAIVGVVLLTFLLSSDSSHGPTSALLPPPDTKISTLTDDDVRQLAQMFGVSEADIRALMAKYPDITLAQLLRMLRLLAWIRQFRQQVQTELDTYRKNKKGKAQTPLEQSFLTLLGLLNSWERSMFKGYKGNIDTQLDGLQNNLSGAWTEWQLAQPYLQQGRLVSFGRKFSYNGKNAQADLVVLDASGNPVFVEIKNIKPADLSIPEKRQALLDQIEREMQVVKGNGFNTLEIDFTQGVDQSLIDEINDLARREGINVVIKTSISVAPPPVP